MSMYSTVFPSSASVCCIEINLCLWRNRPCNFWTLLFSDFYQISLLRCTHLTSRVLSGIHWIRFRRSMQPITRNLDSSVLSNFHQISLRRYMQQKLFRKFFSPNILLRRFLLLQKDDSRSDTINCTSLTGNFEKRWTLYSWM